MKIVCISGKAQHGKDTTAGYLKEYLEANGKIVLIAHYGDLVKYICKTFFSWDGKKDEKGRTLLQHIGTDRIRAKNGDYWVAFIASILEFFPDKWGYVIIPDCRFPNEIEYLEERFDEVVHIRVVRNNPGWTSPLTEEQQGHYSEVALDGYSYDYLVENHFGLTELQISANRIAELLMDGECAQTSKNTQKSAYHCITPEEAEAFWREEDSN